MKIVFDTSVWIEQLRRGALDDALPRLRGRARVFMSAIVAGELLAGARSKSERALVGGLLASFERVGRASAPDSAGVAAAGRALSELREKGRTLRTPAGALLDAIIAVEALRLGAVVVTLNEADFRMLAEVMPLQVLGFDEFLESIADGD